MIDCLPTEMQLIREVFPDCGLHLCDFQNQCWGRWFRITQHGVSQHYELLMFTFKKRVKAHQYQNTRGTRRI